VVSGNLLAGVLAEAVQRRLVRTDRLVVGVAWIGGDRPGDSPHLVHDSFALAQFAAVAESLSTPSAQIE